MLFYKASLKGKSILGKNTRDCKDNSKHEVLEEDDFEELDDTNEKGLQIQIQTIMSNLKKIEFLNKDNIFVLIC